MAPESESEIVLLRMNGGPHPGTRHGEVKLLGWPLPDRLDAPPPASGYYRKVNESQIPEEAFPHPNLMRGAEYEWVDDGSA